MKGSIESITEEAFGYLTSLSIEILFLGGFFLLIIAYGLRSSRGNLIGIILSIYIALLLTPLFPYKDILNVGEKVVLGRFDLGSLLIYFGFIFLAFIAMRRVVDYEWELTRLGGLYQTVALAFFVTGLLSLGAFKTSLIDGFKTLTPVDTLFTTPEYFFWWIFASIITIFITAR